MTHLLICKPSCFVSQQSCCLNLHRYLNQEPLVQPAEVRLPRVYVEPPPRHSGEVAPADRVDTPRLSISERRSSFAEVEKTLDFKDATREAVRCLRCDLAFTQPEQEEEHSAQAGGAA